MAEGPIVVIGTGACPLLPLEWNAGAASDGWQAIREARTAEWVCPASAHIANTSSQVGANR